MGFTPLCDAKDLAVVESDLLVDLVSRRPEEFNGMTRHSLNGC